jgi:hypothetical protein
MPNARLTLLSAKLPPQEIELHRHASIGRAPDNSISIDDRMISQYHALIERRGDSFHLTDLGSTNGTLINGDPLTVERQLQNGDQILVGGVASIEFLYDGEWSQLQELSPDTNTENPIEIQRDPTSEVPIAHTDEGRRTFPALMLGIVIAGIIVAGATVIFVINSLNSTDAGVRILVPETGTTIRGAQAIRVETDGASDIEEVIYFLDGVEIASAEYPPFDATLDPSQLNTKLRNVSSGSHILTATIQHRNGKREPQSDTILLAFDMNTEPRGGDHVTESTNVPSAENTAPSDAADLASLARNLAATISGKGWYEFDRQFTDEIRRRTADYRIDVMGDASRYRRQVGNAFNSKGLPPAVGFVLAIAESRFRENGLDSGSNETIGFWQVPRQIALEQGYISSDESPIALKDPKRSAEIAAAYMNDLVNAFGGIDAFMYAVACYGIPLSQAAAVRTRLEEVDPNASIRRDFSRMVRAGVLPRDATDRVARFFAAGIVAENPRSFGLASAPLSSLY